MAHLLFRGLAQKLKAAKLEVHASEYFMKYNEIVNHQLIRFASSNDGKNPCREDPNALCPEKPYKCEKRQGMSKPLCKSTPYKCEVIVFDTVKKRDRCDNKITSACRRIPFKYAKPLCRPKAVEDEVVTDNRYCQSVPFNPNYEVYDKEEDMRQKRLKAMNNEGRASPNPKFQRIEFEPPKECPKMSSHWDPEPAPIEKEQEESPAILNLHEMSNSDTKKNINVPDKPKECPSRHFDTEPNRDYEHMDSQAKLAHYEMSGRDNERFQKTSRRHWVSAPPKEDEDMKSSAKKECPGTSSRHFKAAPNREYDHMESSAEKEYPDRTSPRHFEDAPTREYKHMERSAEKECPGTSYRHFEDAPTREYKHMESSAEQECPGTSPRHFEDAPNREHTHMESSAEKECPDRTSPRHFEAAPYREHKHMESSAEKECPRTSSRHLDAAPSREYEPMESLRNLTLHEMSNCDKTNTINAQVRSKKIDEMTPLWYFQRTVNSSLALLVPAALVNPSPTLDVFLASALVMHNYWALEAFCEEYVNHSKYAEMSPGIVPVVLVILSGLTLAGLLSLVHNDVGIAKAFLSLWRLQEHGVVCPPTKKEGRW